jgi:hypothetical protein
MSDREAAVREKVRSRRRELWEMLMREDPEKTESCQRYLEELRDDEYVDGLVHEAHVQGWTDQAILDHYGDAWFRRCDCCGGLGFSHGPTDN